VTRDDELSSLVARRLGTEVLATSSVGWGFSAVTLRVRLSSGRHQIAQLRARPEALSIVRATRSLRACGVPVPYVAHVLRATDESAWILFEEVAGDVAAARLGSAAEVGMAATIGSTLAVVQACSASAFTPDPAWVDGRALVASVQRWSQDAEAPVRAAVVASSERVASRSWIPAVSHGDFAPVNVLMAGSAVTALIDLADVRRRHPLVDAAWHLLIVRHHHPASFAGLVDPFLDGSFGRAGRPTEARLADVAVARAAQLASGSPFIGRAHLYELLSTALAWVAAALREAPHN